MRKLLFILVILLCPMVNAEQFEIGPMFDVGGNLYEYQKGYCDHVEILEDKYTNTCYLVMFLKDVKGPKSIIPYGIEREQCYRDFIEQNKIIYKEKNILNKLKHKKAQKYWTNQTLIFPD